jgi:hypothetical protein
MNKVLVVTTMPNTNTEHKENCILITTHNVHIPLLLIQYFPLLYSTSLKILKVVLKVVYKAPFYFGQMKI